MRVPLSRPRASLDEAAAGRHNHVSALLVRLDVDDGPTGLGFAYTLQGSGRALLAVAVDDISPLLQGEDALDHERLGAKVYWALQTIGRRGLVQQAYSAFDVALWDLKAKAANLPLYKLLGGARESAPVYGSDTAWLWMSTDQIVEASRPYLDQGMMGIKVKVGAGPEADADRLTALREAFGDDVWLAVDANERYDYGTALAMGRFLRGGSRRRLVRGADLAARTWRATPGWRRSWTCRSRPGKCCSAATSSPPTSAAAPWTWCSRT